MPDRVDQPLTTDDLLALLESTNRLNRMAPLETALGEILELAANLARSTAGSVLLYDPEHEDLYFAAAIGEKADDVMRLRVPLEGSVAGRVFRSGAATIEDKLATHYRAIDQDTGFRSQSMICVPLVHGGETKGVMQILNKRDGDAPYGDRELALLTRFGEQAALAIGNAELYEQLLGSSGLYARPEVRERLIPLLTSPDSSPIKERFTVLFADIRGFTKLCSRQDPEHIKTILDEYFTALTDELVKRDGIVNKLVGDGILAIFGGERQVYNAACAAFAITDRFHQLRDVWNTELRESLKEFLDIGVGIATDDLVLGRVGRTSCFDFTVIGHGVNFASALCDRARDGRRVLCDQYFYNALRRDRDLRWVESEELEPINLMNIDQKFDAHHLKLEPAKYDVFVSYRRKSGGQAAHAIRKSLGRLRVFVDVASLRSGRYEPVLEKTVATSPNFVVLLTEGCLDRCGEPDDWLAKEVEEALRAGSNVIPVVFPGFEWPDRGALPEELRGLADFEAVPYSHEHFDAMVEKLRSFLKVAPPGR